MSVVWFSIISGLFVSVILDVFDSAIPILRLSISIHAIINGISDSLKLNLDIDPILSRGLTNIFIISILVSSIYGSGSKYFIITVIIAVNIPNSICPIGVVGVVVWSVIMNTAPNSILLDISSCIEYDIPKLFIPPTT